jgi:hypothetical protein
LVSRVSGGAGQVAGSLVIVGVTWLLRRNLINDSGAGADENGIRTKRLDSRRAHNWLIELELRARLFGRKRKKKKLILAYNQQGRF